MRRLTYSLLAGAVVLLMAGGPAFAQDNGQQPVIDLEAFINSFSNTFPDNNGDGIPDIPIGEPGIWDNTVGSATEADFLARVGAGGTGFDINDDKSTLTGPCYGVAISYTPDGESLDAVLRRPGDEGLIDQFGQQKMTSGNPMKVHSQGVIATWGFTQETAKMSTVGNVPGIAYDGNKAFHDHRWSVIIMGVSGDDGGDPNGDDENRNAGLTYLGDVGDESGILPFAFSATVKARGAIIDLRGNNKLPDDFNKDSIASIAQGHEFCFGEGWVEFTGGDGFDTVEALAAALFAAGFAGVLFNARPFLSWRSG
ncbi:MAG: hypothetical protein ACE5E8_00590 [Acidimicrobiia bacterium]